MKLASALRSAMVAFALVAAMPMSHSFQVFRLTIAGIELHGDPNHEDITSAGLIASTVVNASYIKRSGKTIEFDKGVITTIQEANREFDSSERTIPRAHFDDETFDEANKLVKDSKSSIVLLVKEKKNSQARVLLGTALHTLQDFYAHSTWVEVNGGIPNLDLGSDRFKLVKANDATCTVSGIIPSQVVTTGYWNDNQAIYFSTSYNTNYYVLTGLPWPLNRCIHGSSMFNNGNILGKGINKDAEGREGFGKAKSAATLATSAFIVDILTQLANDQAGDDEICGFLGQETSPACTQSQQVTSITVLPTSLTVGGRAVFTVNGTNLVGGDSLVFPGCISRIISTSNTQLQFACTLTQAGTNLQGTVLSPAPANVVLFPFTYTVSAPSGAPDLLAKNIVFTPGAVAAGGNVTVNWSLANQGSAAAAASTTVVRISSLPTSSGTTNLASVSTPALAAGASTSQQAVVAVPATAGTYYVWVIADNLSTSGQPSTATGNDILRAAAALTVSSTTVVNSPDVLAKNIVFTPGAVAAGGNVTVNWSLANQGSAAAAASTTVVRISSLSTSSGTTNLASVSTPALAAGASTSQQAMVAVPATTGTYYVWVIADNLSTSGQPSTAKGNDSNRAAAALTVSNSTVAPTISSVVVNPTVPTVGIQATFSVNGANLQPGYIFSLPGCAATEVASVSTNLRQFTCTPTLSGTNLSGTVSTAAGTVLHAFMQTVGAGVVLPLQRWEIATGYFHSCALTSAGGVKCWGSNSNSTLSAGQLGDGTSLNRLVPVDVVGLSSGVVAVSAGHFHTCALTTAGGVKCWGQNFGALGDGTGQHRLTPVDVVGLGSGVVAISSGGGHTCALTSTGGVKCWGAMGGLGLGDGTTQDRLAPVDVVGLTGGAVAITAGNTHTCALTGARGVKCWGGNLGRLGDGTDQNRLAPVDVVGLGSGVVAIAAGGSQTCAVTNAGGAKCWGNNVSGALGDGTKVNRRTPVDVAGLTSGVVALSAGDNHTCAVTTSGGVKCWGSDLSGQLGDGAINVDRLTPVDVTGLSSGVTAVSAGGQHTCARTGTGSVKCWGFNGLGGLGDGTTNSRAVPLDVVGFQPAGNNPFMGSYAGSYAGGQSGTWAATISVDSTISAAATGGFVGTGSVNSAGTATIALAGTGASQGFTITFSGAFALQSNGTMTGSGTWTSSSGLTGTWAGARLN